MSQTSHPDALSNLDNALHCLRRYAAEEAVDVSDLETAIERIKADITESDATAAVERVG